MKITIESTSKIVRLQVDSHCELRSGAGGFCEIPARVWQGQTESGIPVQVFVIRIAPEIPRGDRRIDELTIEFERDLKRQADARPTVEAIPLRLII